MLDYHQVCIVQGTRVEILPGPFPKSVSVFEDDISEVQLDHRPESQLDKVANGTVSGTFSWRYSFSPARVSASQIVSRSCNPILDLILGAGKEKRGGYGRTGPAIGGFVYRWWLRGSFLEEASEDACPTGHREVGNFRRLKAIFLV